MSSRYCSAYLTCFSPPRWKMLRQRANAKESESRRKEKESRTDRMILGNLAFPFCAVLVVFPPPELTPELLGRLASGMLRVEVGVRVPEDDELAMPSLEVSDLGFGRETVRAVGRQSVVLSVKLGDREAIIVSARTGADAVTWIGQPPGPTLSILTSCADFLC